MLRDFQPHNQQRSKILHASDLKKIHGSAVVPLQIAAAKPATGTVNTRLSNCDHFSFCKFHCKSTTCRSEFPLHSPVLPCCPPPANGQRRGCLRDALAARPADGDWRCKGPHHHAYRVCGGGSHGDGDVVARRAVILAVILVRTFPFAAFSVC